MNFKFEHNGNPTVKMHNCGGGRELGRAFEEICSDRTNRALGLLMETVWVLGSIWGSTVAPTPSGRFLMFKGLGCLKLRL